MQQVMSRETSAAVRPSATCSHPFVTCGEEDGAKGGVGAHRAKTCIFDRDRRIGFQFELSVSCRCGSRAAVPIRTEQILSAFVVVLVVRYVRVSPRIFPSVSRPD